MRPQAAGLEIAVVLSLLPAGPEADEHDAHMLRKAGDQRKNNDQNDALFAFGEIENPDRELHFSA